MSFPFNSPELSNKIVSDGSVENVGDVINCVNFNSDRPKSTPNQTPLEKQIAKIKKLQELGLTEDEIGELLEIPLELVKSASLDKSVD